MKAPPSINMAIPAWMKVLDAVSWYDCEPYVKDIAGPVVKDRKALSSALRTLKQKKFIHLYEYCHLPVTGEWYNVMITSSGELLIDDIRNGRDVSKITCADDIERRQKFINLRMCIQACMDSLGTCISTIQELAGQD